MAAWPLLVALFLSSDPQDKAAPPPLTDEQRARIQQLVRSTQEESMRLKDLLEKRQRELARHYTVYELNADAADRLEKDILDLQRQTLANYRRMQVELRAIVDKDRFQTLRQRLERILGPAGADKPSTDTKGQGRDRSGGQ
jgi:hypothetical protein